MAQITPTPECKQGTELCMVQIRMVVLVRGQWKKGRVNRCVGGRPELWGPRKQGLMAPREVTLVLTGSTGGSLGNKMVVVVVGAAAVAAAAAVDGIFVCSVSVASCGNMAANKNRHSRSTGRPVGSLP